MSTITSPTLTDLLGKLPPRPVDAHKGLFGHVLIIGGAPGMLGAVILAAQAASYVGAGLVTIATHPQHAALVAVAQPNVMSIGVETAAQLTSLLAKASNIVVGPGLGQDNWAQSLFTTALASKLPLLVDADGLNLLAKQPLQHENWILTPHPGEAARLLHTNIQTIQTDRAAAATSLQQTYNAIAVLKGAGTLIQDHKQTILCQAGNPGMATAGMGDVLSGIIGGLVAQHINLFTAAALGVYLHAHAADHISEMQGQRGLLPQDILSVVRRLINGK